MEEGSKTLFTYNSYLNKDCTTAWIYPQSSYTCKVRAKPTQFGLEHALQLECTNTTWV